MFLRKLTVIVLVFFLLPSCDETWDVDCETYEYGQCETEEPFDAKLLATFTINEENPFVPLKIYIGDFENDSVVFTDTTEFADYWIFMPLNKYYTIVGKYRKGEDTIFVVDGDGMNKEKTEICDEVCWDIKGGILDCTLQ